MADSPGGSDRKVVGGFHDAVAGWQTSFNHSRAWRFTSGMSITVVGARSSGGHNRRPRVPPYLPAAVIAHRVAPDQDASHPIVNRSTIRSESRRQKTKPDVEARLFARDHKPSQTRLCCPLNSLLVRDRLQNILRNRGLWSLPTKTRASRVAKVKTYRRNNGHSYKAPATRA